MIPIRCSGTSGLPVAAGNGPAKNRNSTTIPTSNNNIHGPDLTTGPALSRPMVASS